MDRKKDKSASSPPLVWNRPPRASRGPHPAHSRDEIALTAVRIADREGLDAVSIRGIAAELGSGAASLYRYIKEKNELLDLMVDAVITEQELPEPSRNWRTDLQNIAHCCRTMTLQHCWMIDLSAFRSSFGPDSLHWLEFSLKAIDGLGLDIDEMLVMVHSLFAFVRGYVAGEIAERESEKNSGLNRREWIKSRGHYTNALLNSEDFPLFRRVVKDAETPHDPKMAEKGFVQGLDHMLNGFATRIADSHVKHKSWKGRQKPK